MAKVAISDVTPVCLLQNPSISPGTPCRPLLLAAFLQCGGGGALTVLVSGGGAR